MPNFPSDFVNTGAILHDIHHGTKLLNLGSRRVANG